MTTKTISETLPAKCLALTAKILDDAGPIDDTTAADCITNYLDGVKDAGGTDHNFGYVFGMNTVNDFIAKINKYNPGQPVDKQIHGIRVYLGRTQPVQAGEVIAMEKIMDTLFMMPVLSTGEDLYKMPPLADPYLILGGPRPCPNECFMLSFASQ